MDNLNAKIEAELLGENPSQYLKNSGASNKLQAFLEKLKRKNFIPQKTTPAMFLASLAVLLLVSGTLAAVSLTSMSQDIRQMASGCDTQCNAGETNCDGAVSYQCIEFSKFCSPNGIWRVGGNACTGGSGGQAPIAEVVNPKELHPVDQKTYDPSQVAEEVNGKCPPGFAKGHCGDHLWNKCVNTSVKCNTLLPSCSELGNCATGCTPRPELGGLDCNDKTLSSCNPDGTYVTVETDSTQCGGSGQGSSNVPAPAGETPGVGGEVAVAAGGDCSGGKACISGFSCQDLAAAGFRCVKDNNPQNIATGPGDKKTIGSCVATANDCVSGTTEFSNICLNQNRSTPQICVIKKEVVGKAEPGIAAGGTCSVDQDCAQFKAGFICDQKIKRCIKKAEGDTEFVCKIPGNCVAKASDCCDGRVHSSSSCALQNSATQFVCAPSNVIPDLACPSGSEYDSATKNCLCNSPGGTPVYFAANSEFLPDGCLDASTDTEVVAQKSEADVIEDLPEDVALNQHFMTEIADGNPFTWQVTQYSPDDKFLYVFYCPEGLGVVNGVAGVCASNERYLGTVDAGANINFSAFMTQGCGAYQFDVEPIKQSAVGAAGAVTFEFESCSNTTQAISNFENTDAFVFRDDQPGSVGLNLSQDIMEDQFANITESKEKSQQHLKDLAEEITQEKELKAKRIAEEIKEITLKVEEEKEPGTVVENVFSNISKLFEFANTRSPRVIDIIRNFFNRGDGEVVQNIVTFESMRMYEDSSELQPFSMDVNFDDMQVIRPAFSLNEWSFLLLNEETGESLEYLPEKNDSGELVFDLSQGFIYGEYCEAGAGGSENCVDGSMGISTIGNKNQVFFRDYGYIQADVGSVDSFEVETLGGASVSCDDVNIIDGQYTVNLPTLSESLADPSLPECYLRITFAE